MSLDHAELIDWIRLARTSGVGAKTFRNLLNRFGAVSEAIARSGIDVVQPRIAE